VERSTRLSIVEHAIEDVRERLADVPPSKDREKLEALVRQYGMEVELWQEHPPDEQTRGALLKNVLDLSVRVIEAGGPARRAKAEEPDSDDDYPKPL
jgi:hypothetical protein